MENHTRGEDYSVVTRSNDVASIISPALDSDAKAIVTLFLKEQDYSGKLTWYRFEKFRRRTEYWDKCCMEDVLVGFIHWALKSDNTRVVYDLIVHPEFRHCGIGRDLIQHIGSPIQTKLTHPFLTHLGFVDGYLSRKAIMVPDGPWILTYTGRVVNPLDLQPDDVCIEDIAHHLALVNRFAGGTVKPISVAQHSVYVSRLCEDSPHDFQALLHDASEAYLGDITKWVKAEMPAYQEAEDRAQRIILGRFGCEPEIHEDVWRADRVMVMFEAERGFGKAWNGLHLAKRSGYEPITEGEMAKIGKWAPWSWRQSEEAFLVRYRHCMSK